jgi:hypothetical protein
LITEISSQDQPVLINRSKRLGVTPNSIRMLLRPLSPQLVDEARQAWFSTTTPPDGQLTPNPLQNKDETTGRQSNSDSNDLLSSPLDASDLPESNRLSDDSLIEIGKPSDEAPLASDPLTGITPASSEGSSSGQAFDADEMQPAGDWFHNEIRLAIRYRGAGHDDPVLKSMIDVIRQLPEGMAVRDRLLKNRAVAACIACHPGAISTPGKWRSRPLSNARQFTKFTHLSHLNVAELSNCKHCHRVADNQTPTESHTGNVAVDTHVGSLDFLPLTRDACSDCHRPHANGDNCTTCHRYHIDLHKTHAIFSND